MSIKSIGSAMGAALLLSACGTLQGPSGEMVPATAATQMAEPGSQVIRVDGIGKRRGTNYLTFQPNGRVRAEVAGLGIGTDGNWAVEEGKLFGSVTAADIAEAIAAQGHQVDRRRIELDQPIRHVGEHTVAVRLHPEVHADVRVTVVAE